MRPYDRGDRPKQRAVRMFRRVSQTVRERRGMGWELGVFAPSPRIGGNPLAPPAPWHGPSSNPNESALV